MLTAAQHKTYQFIKSFFATHGHAPSTQEIAQGIQIKSRGVVYRYLQALVTEGLITLRPKRRRNIELANKASLLQLPLLGKIAAGQPIEAIDQEETLDIAAALIGPQRFALRVKGESMQEEGIFDGDIVICERSTVAQNGQIVVALIDTVQATLKRLHWNSDQTVTLSPANSQHQVQIYSIERVQIQGIFVGLLRI